MGHYTEFKFKGKLKKDTPAEVTKFLHRIFIERDLGLPRNAMLFHSKDVFKPDFDHPFFKCERWYQCFLGTNFNGENMEERTMKYNTHGNSIILIHSEFKNYDDEIEHFLDWIKPFLAGRKKRQYLGWKEGENWESPRHYIHINLSDESKEISVT